jgi:hypothetical protein
MCLKINENMHEYHESVTEKSEGDFFDETSASSVDVNSILMNCVIGLQPS